MYIHDDVYIRSIEEKDLAFLAGCRNDPVTWLYLGTFDFTNMVKQKTWWETSSTDKSQGNFVFCKLDGEKIGFVRMDELDHMNKSIRVGGDIHPEYRGKGYGTKMYKLILDYCFNQLNMNRVWLFVLDFNVTARTLYDKIGFKEEGRQREAIFRGGKYHDYIMMSILRSEWVKD